MRGVVCVRFRRRDGSVERLNTVTLKPGFGGPGNGDDPIEAAGRRAALPSPGIDASPAPATDSGDDGAA